jgi:hypothetical protein
VERIDRGGVLLSSVGEGTDPAGSGVVEPSCYVLEHSVEPGGARLGDFHAWGDLDDLAASLDRRGGLDPYLVMWYGATLRLWVVQHGEALDDIDLRPYLRTGDERCDRTLARVIALLDETSADRDWAEELEELVDDGAYWGVNALPLLAELFELRDRISADDESAQDEWARLTEAIAAGDRAPTQAEAATQRPLVLDWVAVAAVTSPLRPPVLTTGKVSVRWPGHAEDPQKLAEELHAGVNDLEFGYDEYPPGTVTVQ